VIRPTARLLDFGPRIASFVAMALGSVVLMGGIADGRAALDLLVLKFGWSLRQAESLSQLAELSACSQLATVLFDPKDLDLPWNQALRAVLDVAPHTLPIICSRFADVIDWPRAAEAGAFHLLHLPLDLGEVRQSLEFVSARSKKPQRLRIGSRGEERESLANSASASGMVA